jgi:hypothetical protein
LLVASCWLLVASCGLREAVDDWVGVLSSIFWDLGDLGVRGKIIRDYDLTERSRETFDFKAIKIKPRLGKNFYVNLFEFYQ